MSKQTPAPKSSSEAKKRLPYIEDLSLFKSVSMALWMIIDKDRPLAASLVSAQKKHSYKPRSDIERHVRSVLPANYFQKRRKIPGEIALSYKNQSIENRECTKHMGSII